MCKQLANAESQVEGKAHGHHIFHAGSTPIAVSHKPYSEFRPAAEDHPIDEARDCRVIVASNCEPNTLTRIELQSAVLYVHWEKHESTHSAHVLFVPETSVLFFGAGTVAMTVRGPSLAGAE